MMVAQRLSLGLDRDASAMFEAGGLRTVEAAGRQVVGIPKHGDGHHRLGPSASRDDAVVVATLLRLLNPN